MAMKLIKQTISLVRRVFSAMKDVVDKARQLMGGRDLVSVNHAYKHHKWH